ncbi:MAG: NADH-quinone oxidoreductase subunit NuoE [Nitrospiraceae bacterium]|nr:NADH-quinone oxidoreductase subunit NuoE [Nitrospiraceae bacterium]
MLTSEQVNKLEEICKRHNKAQSAVIPVLQDVQELFGYVPEDAVNFVADSMGMPRSHFFGVATFYAQFHFKPRGKNIITACSGTACHVKGSGRLIDNLARELGIPEGEETSRDRQFTLEKVNCVGACSIAPVIIINKEVHGKMSSDKLMKEIKKLRPE